MERCNRCLNELTEDDDLDRDRELCDGCIMDEWERETKQFRREHNYEVQ